jgi:hypothetical protein
MCCFVEVNLCLSVVAQLMDGRAELVQPMDQSGCERDKGRATLDEHVFSSLF